MLCLFTIYLLPAFVVLISTEIVRQGRLRRIATEDTVVDKLPDYLKIDTKDGIRGKKPFVFLDSGQLYLAMVNYNSPPVVKL